MEKKAEWKNNLGSQKLELGIVPITVIQKCYNIEKSYPKLWEHTTRIQAHTRNPCEWKTNKWRIVCAICQGSVPCFITFFNCGRWAFCKIHAHCMPKFFLAHLTCDGSSDQCSESVSHMVAILPTYESVLYKVVNHQTEIQGTETIFAELNSTTQELQNFGVEVKGNTF